MKRLILAGAGHAHLAVIRQLALRPWPGVEVTLVAPYPRQIYSGMIPGWMAGHYTLEQCAAPLAPLLAAAGIRWVADAVCGVDAGNVAVDTLESRKITGDVLSLDTGAGIDPAALAGSGDALLAIRPLERFATRWEAWLAARRAAGEARLAVVGGGAAGVELALAADYALRRHLPPTRVAVTLVGSGPLLAGHAPGVRGLVAETLASRGITVHDDQASGVAGGLRLAGGETIIADGVIAATGVVPPPWLQASGLALCPRGFVAVGDGQQSISHAAVFAAGDVASRIDHPHARSGVFAVRAGPVLAANLPRALAGAAPLPYRPQKRSLYLLATGPREAIVSWGSFSARGAWAWRWKDWIDRRFMRQYQP
jgi:pyridine nucleotide-disulfide oxidoreductase family protein